MKKMSLRFMAILTMASMCSSLFLNHSVEAVTAGIVDLTVTDIRLNGSNAVVFDLANLDEGTVDPADNVETAYNIDGTNVGTYSSTSMSINDYLNPLGTQTIETIYSLMDGLHTVEVCVDSDYSVVETNETNNCVTEYFRVGESDGLPDLTMSSVLIWSTDEAMFVDQSAIMPWDDPTRFVFYYTVTDASDVAVGAADSTESGDTAVFVEGTDPESGMGYSSAAAIYPWSDAGTWDFLSAGGSSSFAADEVTTSFSTADLRRADLLDFCVDSGYSIEESNEDNNCIVMSNPFHIYPSLPDLAISSVTLNSDNTLHVVIDNLGDADVGEEDFPSFVLYDLTNVGDGETVENFDLDTMGTGYRTAEGQVVFNTSYALPGSSSTEVYASVDPDNRVEESNGENNTFDGFFVPVTSSGGSSDGGSTPTSSSSSGGGAGFVANSHHSSSTTTSGSGDNVVLTSDTTTECAPLPFVDVAQDSADYDAINTLWCLGVVKGRDATHFVPGDTIQRAEAAKIVARLFGYVVAAQDELPEVSSSYFSDMASSSPLLYYVQTLTDQGFFATEKSSGFFRPTDTITSSEIADLLSQVTGQAVTASGTSMTRGAFATLVVSLQ